MYNRSLLLAGALAGVFAYSAAEAALGTATGDVNLRTGPSTSYAKIDTIPAGARVDVHGCPDWCQVTFRGQTGWASSNYISTAAYAPGPVVVTPVPRYAAPVIVDIDPLPPRRYWRHGRPRWDDRYHAWHDGHGWWYDGRWNARQPSVGVHFRFDG